MILKLVKLEPTFIFVKYITNLAPSIFPPKTLIRNKMVLSTLNLLNLPELVENELEKTFSSI